MRRLMIAIALATAAGLAPPASAFERTGSVVADALLRTLEASGYENAAAGAVRREGGTTILADVTATAEGGDTLAIDGVRIENGLVNADNALVADRVAYADTVVSNTGAGGSSRIDSIVLDGVTFSPDGTGSGLAALLGTFDTLSVTDAEARAASGDAVTVEAMAAAVEEWDTANAVSGRLSITDLSFDVALWGEPMAAQMRALGYETITVSLSAAGSWRAATGHAEVREAQLAGDGLGTLSLTAEVDGLKGDVLGALGERIDDLSGLVELLQSISVSSLSLAYDDDGLVERLMTRTAEQTDTDPAALAGGLAAAAGEFVARLGNEGFTARATQALRTFLSQPGTLRVAATPEAPVTAAQILGVAMMRPELLPGLLNVEIAVAP